MLKKIKSLNAYVVRKKLRDIYFTCRHQLTYNNFSQKFVSNAKDKKFVFTLDLHTSVVRDFASLLTIFNVVLTRWSITPSSHIFNEPNLKIKHVNNRTWKKLDSNLTKKFQKTYSNFLIKQNGFIISHTLSFVNLFKKYNLPILGINSSRYESPFTFNHSSFLNLNSTLRDYSKLWLISNNIGDRDYLKYFTDLDSRYVPSLCNYTVQNKPENDIWLIQCRDLDLAKKISIGSPNLKSLHEMWPKGYSYKELSTVKGIVLLPYNISTMQIFELTTAGFPIRIPSDRLLLELKSIPGILSELSYAQINERAVLDINLNSPMDPGWYNFYNWWLERADWNNIDFFPNVTRFDTFEELAFEPKPFKIEAIYSRNTRISEMWKRNLENFMKSL